MKTQCLLVLLPLTVFAACGGDSEFEGDGNRPTVPLEELPERYASAQCELFRRCAGFFYDLVFDLEECETLAARQFRDGGFAELEDAIEDGRVSYDPQKAAVCLDVLANKECREATEREVPECEAALGGSTPNGEACSIDAECEGSSICQLTDSCPGVCVDRYGAGVACRDDDQCADGLVCSDVTGLCAQPKLAGETCGGGVEAQCQLGLACIGDDRELGEPGTCRRFDELETAGEGEPCDLEAGTLCESGLSCVLVDSVGPSFECRAIPASGGACHLGIPEHCPTGEYCPLSLLEILAGIVESECVPLPRDGETCADRTPFNGLLARCEAYARCEATTNECLALRDLGETCSSDALCYSQSCVNGGCAARGCP